MADEQATPTPAPKTSAPSAEAALQSLEDRIRKDAAGVRTANMITGIVGIVLAIFLFAYLGRLVTRLGDAMEPKNLAGAILGTILPEVGPVAADIKADLKEGAPKYVGMLFTEAVNYTPTLRKHAEVGAMHLLDQILAELQKNFKQAIGDVLKKADKAKLKMAIDTAAEGKPAELEKILREDLEVLIGMEMDRILNEKFYPQMKDIERQLDQLLTIPDAQLTLEQQQKKKWITTVLFMVEEAAGESAKP